MLSPGDGVTPLDTREWFVQLPFVILVSCGGAFLGALFNALHKLLLPVQPTYTCQPLLQHEEGSMGLQQELVLASKNVD